jgi:hypothetical protein
MGRWMYGLLGTVLVKVGFGSPGWVDNAVSNRVWNPSFPIVCSMDRKKSILPNGT